MSNCRMRGIHLRPCRVPTNDGYLRGTAARDVERAAMTVLLSL